MYAEGKVRREEQCIKPNSRPRAYQATSGAQSSEEAGTLGPVQSAGVYPPLARQFGPVQSETRILAGGWR